MTNVTKMAVAALLGAVVAGCSIPPRSEWPQTVKLRNDSIMAAKLMPAGVADMVAADGEEATIAVAKKRVGELLKDPDSAKYDAVAIVDYNGGKVVCGSVNAKNSYGGYVGYHRFLAGIYAAQLWNDSERDPDIRAAINAGLVAACASAPRSAYR